MKRNAFNPPNSSTEFPELPHPRNRSGWAGLAFFLMRRGRGRIPRLRRPLRAAPWSAGPLSRLGKGFDAGRIRNPILLRGRFLLLSLLLASSAHGAWSPLHTWYSPGREDHSTTSESGWQGSPGETRSPDYRFVRDEGWAVTPDLPQPPDTVGLYGWYSPGRGDNWTTSQWPGAPGDTLSPDYGFNRLHGYAYTMPLAGTVPLNAWWSGPRGDNRATSDPAWAAGLPSPDPGNEYTFVRTEGYVVQSANQPPYDPEFFGYRTKTVNGRIARTPRALLVVLVQYSDQRFRSPHTITYYRDLIFGGLINATPNVAGYFYWNSDFRFRWTEAGVVLINMPDDPTTSADESTFAYWASPAGAANVGKHGQLALQAVSSQINFATYDGDGNGTVERDELAALLINSDPPGADCGQTRGHQTFSTDGKTIDLSISAVAQGVGFGTIVHELFHQLGTDHIYGTPRINTGYSAMAATCAGEDNHQYFHADAWHKMRLGWLEPRVFAVNAPGSSDYLMAPQFFDEGFSRGPILLFDPVRQTSAGKEYFLLEYRKPTTGSMDNYDQDVPGTGLVVWWVRTGPGSDEFIHFKKILPGANGTFQTTIPAGSDDRLVDANGDGVADQIQPGPDFVLQSQAVMAGDDILADDPALILYGAPNQTWGTGRPWTSADGDIRLRYYDGTDAGIVVRVGGTALQGNLLSVQWRRESALRPRLDSVTPHAAYSCNRLQLSGVLPVNGPTRANLISATGVARECEIDPLNTDLRYCQILLPNDTPAGDYEVELWNGSVRGNRLRYHLASPIGVPAGQFAFERASYSRFESDGTATIAIRRSGGTCGPVRIRCALNGGTATSGRDFTWSLNPRYIDFAHGQVLVEFTIPILQDSIDEDPETIDLILESASNGGVVSGISTTTLTILDDDPEPAISVSDTDVTEGDGVSSFVEVPVTLSTVSERTITVTLSTADSSARAGLDYRSTNVMITIPPGHLWATQRIEILPDDLDEYDEPLLVNLSAPSAARIGDGQGWVTILDNDPAPELRIGDVALTEGDSGIQLTTFEVSLTKLSGKEIQFNAASEDGTALAGEDYEPFSFSFIRIPAGMSGVRIPVTITARPGPEPDETFSCRLTDPLNVTIAKAAGVCVIKELRFLSIERDGADIVLTLPSCLGEVYHILRTTSLDDPTGVVSWIPVTPSTGLSGTGTTLTFRDADAAVTGGRHYYRILSEPADVSAVVP